jgi:hypothetical protein
VGAGDRSRPHPRDALLEDADLYLMLGSAVAVACLGVRLLRRRRARALVTGERLTFDTVRPARRHVVGSVVFGAGWAIADSCPGPIAAQLGQGVPWSPFTLVGVGLGVWLALRRQDPAPRSVPAAVVRGGRAEASWIGVAGRPLGRTLRRPRAWIQAVDLTWASTASTRRWPSSLSGMSSFAST